MPESKRQKKALRTVNYDLFHPESMAPPAPATVDSKVREAVERSRPDRVETVQARPERVRTELPPVTELYRLFDLFNNVYFGGKLPRVKIEYSTRMFSAGSYSPNRKMIRIGKKYHEIFPQDLEDTLKHEMIHIRHYRHDAGFRAEAARIGASMRAREHADLRRPPKYIYVCPGCGMEYPRQKRLVMASCGRCSRGRRFDPRFKLVRKKSTSPARTKATT